MNQMKLERLALGQGVFYVATGVWPILHLRSFEAVTGPKPAGWLVKTVGALVGVVGGTLVRAARARRVTPELQLLGAGCALSLAVVDVVYAGRGRISPVYLLDAAVELGLVGAWWALRPKPQAHERRSLNEELRDSDAGELSPW